MNCQEVQKGLLQTHDPALVPGIQEHLERCPDCTEIARVWRLLGEVSHPTPPAHMGIAFRVRLDRELQGQPPRRIRSAWWVPMAAAAGLILALGIALGRQWRQESPASPAGFTALRYGSTTDRLEAIALVSGRSTSGPELQDALLDRVQHDSSPEVRLSAVEALYLFGSDPSLSRKLEAALPLQTRPEVQLALVDLLAAIRQERAADALRRLIQSGQLSGSVQRRAQQRLSQMNL